MKRISTCAALVLVSVTNGSPARAAEVTWEMTGTVMQAFGIDGIFVGDPFRVLATFDTEAPLLQAMTGGRFEPGARYEYDPSAVSLRVTVASNPEVAFEVSPDDTGLLWLRDNSGDTTVPGGAVVDGFTISWRDPSGNAIAEVIFRGTLLDIFDGPGLPTAPDQRLLNLELATFQQRMFGVSALTGTIETVELITDPAELVSDLVNKVNEFNLPSGIANALESKLQNVIDALGRTQQADTPAATQMLGAFINGVEAQRGRALTDVQADELIDAAQATIEALM